MSEAIHQTKIIPIAYAGLNSDSHILDLQEFGISLQGLGKLANSVFNFYLDGDPLKDSRRYRARFFAQAPKQGSMLVDIVGEMVNNQLPLYAPMIWQTSIDYVLPLIKAVIAKRLNRPTEMEKALEIISNMASNQHALATQMHLGHMTDKEHLHSHLDSLIKKNSMPLKQLVAPIGKTCRQISVGENENPAQTIIGEPEADVLSTNEELTVEDSKEYEIILAAVDTLTGSCRFQYQGSTKIYSGKITDPILHTPQNPYTSALHTKAPITVEAKALTQNSEITKLYISNSR